MVFGEFKVNTQGFEEWVITVHNRFPSMVNTMLKVHKMLDDYVSKIVPYDTGRLESSFHPIIYDYSPTLIEMHSRYTAIDPYDGYDYAEYQHIGIDWQTGAPLYHPNGRESEYLLKGIMATHDRIIVMIEHDYLSLFNGGII